MKHVELPLFTFTAQSIGIFTQASRISALAMVSSLLLLCGCNSVLFEAEVFVEPVDSGLLQGSLIEITDEAGSLVLGFGFEHGYQTRSQRGDSVVQLFVRDSSDIGPVINHGKGGDYFSGYFSRFREMLIVHARTSGTEGNYAFDPQTRKWQKLTNSELVNQYLEFHRKPSELGQSCGAISSISSTVLLTRNCAFRSGELIFHEGMSEIPQDFRGLVPTFISSRYLVLESPDIKRNGSLVCDVRTRLSFDACTFLGYEDSPELVEFTYAIAESANNLLLSTNLGSVLEFSGEESAAKALRVRDGSSFQLYSAVHYGSQVLLGEYPYGAIMKWSKAKPLNGYRSQIPYIDGARLSLPEVQSLSNFKGDLYAGVWPWGELWRMRDDQWEVVHRFFDQPPVGSDIDGVYYAQLGTNLLGQRVSGITSLGGSLYALTGAKDSTLIDARQFEGISEDFVSSYGNLYEIEATGVVSVELGPHEALNMRIQISGSELILHSGGKVVARTPVDLESEFCWKPIVKGKGTFGDLQGGKVEVNVIKNSFQC